MGMASDWLNRKAEAEIKSDDTVEIGIGGFVLGARLKETSSFKQTVTENYIEDGSNISDHIIETPFSLSIDIVIGEIDRSSTIINSQLKGKYGEIGVITKYLPSKTNTQLSKITNIILGANDVLNKVDDILDDGQQIYNVFNKDQENLPIQEMFLSFIESLYEFKIPIAIDMPYRTHQNMVIGSVTITRNNETNEAMSCTITATKVRTAKVLLVDSKKYFKEPSDGTGGQTKSKASKGVTSPQKTNKSFIKIITGG